MARYKKPSLTADMIIVRANSDILLIQRGNYPFKGKWALPGGFINYGTETIEDCAIREAREETALGVKIKFLLGIWSEPLRDPRGHTISAVFVSKLISIKNSSSAKAGDDAVNIMWITPQKNNIQKIDLAFDHKNILLKYIQTLPTHL